MILKKHIVDCCLLFLSAYFTKYLFEISTSEKNENQSQRYIPQKMARYTRNIHLLLVTILQRYCISLSPAPACIETHCTSYFSGTYRPTAVPKGKCIKQVDELIVVWRHYFKPEGTCRSTSCFMMANGKRGRERFMCKLPLSPFLISNDRRR